MRTDPTVDVGVPPASRSKGGLAGQDAVDEARSRPVRPLLAVMRPVVSWVFAVALLMIGLPAAVGVSWSVVMPVVTSLRWTSACILVAVWCLGLFVHSFLLTAAAPGLTRSRAVTVHVTGSAVASVMPFGGAAGLEVHRRMLRSWGVGGRAFAGYALLITTWGIGCKLLLPLVAAITLGAAGETVTTPLRAAGLASGLGFLVLVAAGAALLASERWAIRLGGVVDGLARRLARSTSGSHQTRAATAVVGIRHDCSRLVANGWARMTTGIAGYAALQCLLLGVCLHLAGAGNTVPEVVTGFAVERMVTILPITPGGVGVGDLGLVTVLLAFGGNPAGVAAAALLYRTFVFTVEVPVGACLLGLWLLRRRASRRDATGGPRPAQPVERALARSSVVRSPLPDEHP